MDIMKEREERRERERLGERERERERLGEREKEREIDVSILFNTGRQQRQMCLVICSFNGENKFCKISFFLGLMSDSMQIRECLFHSIYYAWRRY